LQNTVPVASLARAFARCGVGIRSCEFIGKIRFVRLQAAENTRAKKIKIQLFQSFSCPRYEGTCHYILQF
jgi:hypothetical protein